MKFRFLHRSRLAPRPGLPYTLDISARRSYCSPLHFPCVPPSANNAELSLQEVIQKNPARPSACECYKAGPKHYEAFLNAREYGPLYYMLQRWKANPTFPPARDLIADAIDQDQLYPDGKAYAVCVEVLAEDGEIATFKLLHEHATENGMLASSHALYQALLQAYARIMDVDSVQELLSARQTLDEVAKPLGCQTIGTLIGMYKRIGAWDRVDKWFEYAKEHGAKDIAIATSLIKAYNGQPSKLLEVTQFMGVKTMVGAYASLGDVEQVQKILNEAQESKNEVWWFSSLVTAHCKAGNISDALSVYESIPSTIRPNAQIFEALLGSMDLSNLEAAMGLLEETFRLRIRPSNAFFAQLLRTAHNAKREDLVDKCLRQMVLLRVKLDVNLHTMLERLKLSSRFFRMAVGCGYNGIPHPIDPKDIHAAKLVNMSQVLKDHGMRSTSFYNLGIRSVIAAGLLHKLPELENEMRASGCCMDRTTFAHLMLAYRHIGPKYADKVIDLYREMVTLGVQDLRLSIGRLIQTCAEAGYQKELQLALERLEVLGHKLESEDVQAMMTALIMAQEPEKARELLQLADDAMIPLTEATQEMYRKAFGE